MKSTQRHDLRRNELLEVLSNPRELVRRYGLPILIVIVATVVAVYFIFRAAGAEDRKWHRAWAPLNDARQAHSEEQLKSIADDTGFKKLIRAWANVSLGELLYSKSQQSNDQASRTELLKEASAAYRQALEMGDTWREVVGQATIGLGLCYEDLGQMDLAAQQYESIISHPDERFAATVWLAKAESRKAILAKLPDERIVFAPEPPADKPADTNGEPPADPPTDTPSAE